MADAEAEFRTVETLAVEALGDPGQRTFRILVHGGGGSAILWLEKDQLFQRGMAIRQLLLTVPAGTETALDDDADGGALPVIEFKIGKLLMGRDAETGKFLIDAYDVEEDEDSPPGVRVWGRREQLESLAGEALAVCAAGRPLCPLCGGPIDNMTHICPRRNGHNKVDSSELSD